MNTTMSSAKYKQQLQKRLDALKKVKATIMAQYRRDIESWKLDLCRWLDEHGRDRVNGAKLQHTWSHSQSIDYVVFFAGSPKPPNKPTIDKKIREIQTLIRQLDISGRQMVNLSTDDVTRYFGTEAGDTDQD